MPSRAPPRHYSFSLITYLNEKELNTVLFDKLSKWLKHYAYIYHNRDKAEPHIHCLVNLYQAKSINAFLSFFSGFTDKEGKTINTLCQPILTKQGIFNYLTHENENDKFHYSKDLVICDDLKFWECDTPEIDNLTQACEDLLNKVPLQIVMMRYGRDFIMHYGHIRQLLIDIERSNQQ